MSDVLKKPEEERTEEEADLVKNHPEVVKKSKDNAKKLQARQDRLLEVSSDFNIYHS